MRKLADYVAEEVFAGWEALPGKLIEGDQGLPLRGVGKEVVQGEKEEEQENRYARLYREIRGAASFLSARHHYNALAAVPPWRFTADYLPSLVQRPIPGEGQNYTGLTNITTR